MTTVLFASVLATMITASPEKPVTHDFKKFFTMMSKVDGWKEGPTPYGGCMLRGTWSGVHSLPVEGFMFPVLYRVHRWHYSDCSDPKSEGVVLSVVILGWQASEYFRNEEGDMCMWFRLLHDPFFSRRVEDILYKEYPTSRIIHANICVKDPKNYADCPKRIGKSESWQ